MTVTAKDKELIKRQGYAPIGGLPRQIYWTPDGREVRAIKSEREYNIKDEEGNVTGSGLRDANLDKGWLLTPPTDPKPYCAGCDRWHDTEEEVTLCIATKQEKAKKWEDWARKQREGEAMEQAKELEELKLTQFEMKGDMHTLMEQNKKLMEMLEANK